MARIARSFTLDTAVWIKLEKYCKYKNYKLSRVVNTAVYEYFIKIDRLENPHLWVCEQCKGKNNNQYKTCIHCSDGQHIDDCDCNLCNEKRL